MLVGPGNVALVGSLVESLTLAASVALLVDPWPTVLPPLSLALAAEPSPADLSLQAANHRPSKNIAGERNKFMNRSSSTGP